MGSDVEALYPSLDADRVAKIIYEAILNSKVTWQNVDYLEACRYIALNWSAEECRKNKLRRVLPTRRGKTGVRPGVRGEGPMGLDTGDSEQWRFPRVKLTEEEKKEIVATVMKIATEFMFKSHIYTFAGKMYKQKTGGPIGLRGTCAIARLVMQVWDKKWLDRMAKLNVAIELAMRYMDDGRAILYAIKAGWRWAEGELKFCRRWELEDQELTPTERTRRVLHGTMMGIEDFLNFTMETGEDFSSGWLATLDTDLRMGDNNQVLYNFYEKPMSSNMCINKDSGMDENSKMKILANDLVRRLLNTSESLGMENRIKVVDDYSQKLLNSGYRREQVQRIIVNGIKAYERKLKEHRDGIRNLHRTAGESGGARSRKKLLDKSEWFKGKRKTRKETEEQNPEASNTIRQGGVKKSYEKYKIISYKKQQDERTDMKTRTVLFVEQTEKGRLAKSIREVLTRLESLLGFRVKVVERSGTSLRNLMPNTNPWAGSHCSRTECTTCNQVGEVKPDCTRRNLVYENICNDCNPGAVKKGELVEVNKEVPSVYVGETARFICERAKEHWAVARLKKTTFSKLN